MNNNSIVLPAEWEGHNAVLLAWPHAHTDWAYMLTEAETCYENMVRAISRHAKVVVIAPDTTPIRERLKDIPKENLIFFDAPTNDTWIRDYGPITTLDGEGNPIVNDFGFNAWGGKFEHALDNAVNALMKERHLITAPTVDHNHFILEGGSIESDGKGTLLTTESCLLTTTRNSSLSRKEIEDRLHQWLGVKKVLWLTKGNMIGDDTDGHIDTIARLAPDNTILYNGTGWGTEDLEQAKELEGIVEELKEMTNASEQPFNLVELPLPDPVHDPDDGHRLPATYANFLIINNALILPTYGQPMNDQRAEMAIRVAFPHYEIEKVDCRALVRQHGSLHCATMQIPESALAI